MSYPVIATPDDEAWFAAQGRELDPKIRHRIIMERMVIRKACRDILAAGPGYWLRVHNGEDWSCERTRDLSVVMANLAQTDIDNIVVSCSDAKSRTGYSRVGWFQCVYGNDGWDVIANNTTNLDERGLLTGATELANKLDA